MKLSEILPKLTAWFPPEAHQERELPKNAGIWYYVPWQAIRDRLNEVCPDNWTVTYDEPRYLDKYCFVSCTVTICGISRQAIGSAQIELISSKGNDMSRGNPLERAVADAFKNACEQFGIAAYLDEQTGDRAKFAQYMHKHGNSKAVVQMQNEQRGHARPKPTATPKPFGQAQTSASTLVKPAQVGRLWAIAKGAKYTEAGVHKLIEAFGFSSVKEITMNVYDAICDKAKDPEYAEMFNKSAAVLANDDEF